ncbi:hypothetical protein [Cognatishimia activa]|nr:hypothetical protein [Cognatishimia activa]
MGFSIDVGIWQGVMRRFIIHAGFHKTATSTVQKTLEAHQDVLSPFVQLIPRKKLKPTRKSAQIFSVKHDPVELGILQAMFVEVLSELKPDDPRPVLMSSEDFAGYLIGRHGIKDYRAAPAIAAALKETLELVFGDKFDLVLYYSTRNEGWLDSCHWQLIKNSDKQITLEAFRKRYANAADFAPIISQVKAAIEPSQVISAAIEDHAGTLGPLQPLLDLCGLPENVQSKITLARPQNVSGSDTLREELLALSETDKDGLVARKGLTRARRTLIRQSKKR